LVNPSAQLEYCLRPVSGQLTIRKTHPLAAGGVPLSPDVPRPAAGRCRAFVLVLARPGRPGRDRSTGTNGYGAVLLALAPIFITKGHVTDRDGVGKQSESPTRVAARASGSTVIVRYLFSRPSVTAKRHEGPVSFALSPGPESLALGVPRFRGAVTRGNVRFAHQREALGSFGVRRLALSVPDEAAASAQSFHLGTAPSWACIQETRAYDPRGLGPHRVEATRSPAPVRNASGRDEPNRVPSISNTILQ